MDSPARGSGGDAIELHSSGAAGLASPSPLPSPGVEPVSPHRFSVSASATAAADDSGLLRPTFAAPAVADGAVMDSAAKGGDATPAPSHASLWRGQILAFHYVWADTRRSRRSLFIGLFTVFLVVFFVSLLQNSVLKSPIIFFKISENSVGENDLILTPGAGIADQITQSTAAAGGSTLPLLNQTSFDDRFAAYSPYADSDLTGSIEGSAPRWLMVAEIVNPSSTPVRSTTGIVLAIESGREEAIKLGRAWKFPAIAAGETILSRTIVRQVGLDPETAVGVGVTFRLDLFSIATTLGLVKAGDDGTVGAPQMAALISQTLALPPDFWGQPITAGTNLTALIDTFDINRFFNLSQYGVTGVITIPLPIPGTGQTYDFNITLPNTFNLTVINDLFATLNSLNLLPFQVPVLVLPPGFDTSTIANFGDLLNDVIRANLDAAALNATRMDVLTLLAPSIQSAARVNTPLSIAGVVNDPEGKWATALGSIILLEADAAWGILRSGIQNLLAVNVSAAVLLPAFNIPPLPFGLPPIESLLPVFTLQSLIQLANPSFNASVLTSISSALNGIRVNDYAFTSTVQYSDRVAAYLSDKDTMNARIARFTNDVSLAIGVDSGVGFSIPLALALAASQIVRVFLDNIFGAVMALVVLLGVLLIYSLLLNDVESKTYEYGMLRALGMTQKTMIQIMITKAFGFAIPGVATGLFFAFLFNIPIAQRIAAFASLEPTYELASAAVGAALGVGFIMPLIANIVPTSRALSRTLRDSLDVYHHVVSDVTVRVIKLAELGLDLWQTCLAILLVVVGFVVFYVIPYAFTFGNIPMFLGVLMGILLGMLLGFCIIAQMVQPYLERVMVKLMLFYHNRNLQTVVLKNLSGHRKRNSKTAQMFTICLAFIIFAGVMFSLQSRSLADNVRVLFGADLFVRGTRSATDSLRETEMRAYLDIQKSRYEAGEANAVVVDYTFVTFPLTDSGPIGNNRFSTLPQFPLTNIATHGIERNYLHVTYNQYYNPTSIDKTSTSDTPFPSINGRPDAIAALYDLAGQHTLPEESDGIHIPPPISTGAWDVDIIPPSPPAPGTVVAPNATEAIKKAYTQYVDVIVSQALRDAASVSVSTPLDLRLFLRNPNTGYGYYSNYLCKARALVSKVPGFFYSSYRQAAALGAVLISMDNYHRLVGDGWNYVNASAQPDVPMKQTLLIRCADGSTQDERDDVINGLRPFFRSSKTIAIDTQFLIDTTNSAVALMNLFFTVVGIVAMVMCFFILWLSFTANVHENAWEFGVLRAVGLNSTQVVMVYVYEALALVLSSVLIGTAIGLIIAISLTLQFNLFTEMPFALDFPHSLFWSLLSMALAVAVAGSYLPARAFMRKSISNVLRRT